MMLIGIAILIAITSACLMLAVVIWARTGNGAHWSLKLGAGGIGVFLSLIALVKCSN